ncbi:ABC transporter substrate-binding protein [Bradyrhizobium sp.]|uniref:ABC transporter substrate-binding protein n=1 Tax=Bradyrhizobium sp. TaxID=376 RepID=UPI0040380FF6
MLRQAPLAGTALLALALFALNPPGRALAADDVKVGVLLPLSGPVAPIGQNNRRGHALAIDEVNAAGGVKSLGGAKLVIVDGDTQGNPKVGIQEAEKLVTQGVAAILGAYQSNVTFPSTQVAEKAAVPYIDPVAIADTITEGRNFKYTFKVAPKASWYARDQLKFIKWVGEKSGKPIKRVVLMYEDTLFGQSTSKGQEASAKELGMEVVEKIAYPAESPDMTPTISRIKQIAPDALVLVSYIADAVLITKTMKELGVNVPIMGTSAGHIDPAYITNLGPLAENSFTVGEWNPDLKKKGAAEIAARFQAKFGVPMNGHAAETYMSTMVLVDALERAGSADRAKLREALTKTNICGERNILPYNCIRFEASGQSPEGQLVMLQVQNGKFVSVWPPEVAAASPVYPVPAWK